MAIQMTDAFEGGVTGRTAVGPFGAVRPFVVLQMIGRFKGLRTQGAPEWSDFRVHQLVVLSDVVRTGETFVAPFTLIDSGFVLATVAGEVSPFFS